MSGFPSDHPLNPGRSSTHLLTRQEGQKRAISVNAVKDCARNISGAGHGTLGALWNLAWLPTLVSGTLGARKRTFHGTLGALRRDFRGASILYSCMSSRRNQ